MRVRRAPLAFAAALLLSLLLAAPAAASIRFQARVAEGISFPGAIGGGCQNDFFVAQRDDGIAYLSDPSDRRFHHFSSGRNVRGAAPDCQGNVFVLEGERVAVYLDGGGFGIEMGEWGGKGSAPGRFERPLGIAADRQGNVYVADTGNDRIQKFDGEGRLLAAWGRTGSGDGAFRAPAAIAIDRRGNVYVADRDNDRIQKFGPGGEFIAAFGNGSETRRPVALAVDSVGLYVLDGRGELRRYSLTGTPLDRMKIESGGDEFRKPAGLGVDREGRVYVADEAAIGLRRYLYTPERPSFVAAWGGAGGGPGQLRRPTGLAYDRADRLWVADTGNGRVQQFTPAGGFVSQIGSPGSDRGRFNSPVALAVGPRYVYVADTGNGRVQKWTDAGGYVRAWRSPGVEEGPQPFAPNGIALAYAYHNHDSSDVWVADPLNDQIELFSSSGTYVGRVGSPGPAPGQFRGLRGLAADTHGYVYTVEAGNNRVQKFTREGDYVGSFGGSGNELDDLRGPAGVAIDARGNVLVADTGNDRIVKYDPRGGFMVAWGGKGSGQGQFDAPTAVATDRGGGIFVADSGNDRIEKFRDPTYAAQAPTPAAQALNLVLHLPDGGSRPCEASDLLAAVAGEELAAVKRATFFLGGDRIGTDRTLPFKARVHRPRTGTTRRYRVWARVVLDNGERATLTSAFRGCPKQGTRELGLTKKPRARWHWFHAEFRLVEDPPDRSSGCIHPERGRPFYGFDDETCYGRGVSGPGFEAPFDAGSRVELSWTAKQGKFEVRIGVDPDGSGWESLRGWSPPLHSRDETARGVLYVTDGEIDEWLTLRATSGDDFDLAGGKGGPLRYEAHSVNKAAFGGTLFGYKLELSGYLRY